MNDVGVSLVPATFSDAQILFEWRNDPTTQAASHNSDQLQFSEHEAWLERTLQDKNRKLYLYHMNGIPVGTVRADKDEDGFEISWSVAPDYRGKGIGTEMVAYFANFIEGKIKAEVKTSNIASARIAESAGMKLEREENGVLYYRR